MWSDEQLAEVMHAGQSAAPDGIAVPALPASSLKAIMNRTAEILRACGGTMTAEELRSVREEMEMTPPVLPSKTGTADLLGHIAAQGATVATLQAKVAELETAHTRTREHLLDKEDECKNLRAEVERLKREVNDKEVARKLLERARDRNRARAASAESRLAAVRERSGAETTWQRYLLLRGDPRAAWAEIVRFMLNGDAPNAPGFPDVSTQDAQAVCAEIGIAHGPVKCHHGCTRGSEGEDDGLAPRTRDHARLTDEMTHYPEVMEVRTLTHGMVGHEQTTVVSVRYPCSDTCTHDDAATSGHPERVKEHKSALDAVLRANYDAARADDDNSAAESDSYDRGAEAMRAACWEAVQRKIWQHGLHNLEADFKAAIEGATPYPDRCTKYSTGWAPNPSRTWPR